MRKRSRTPLEVRFWKKVQKGDGCWLWTGATRGDGGYGVINDGGKLVAAHRVSWQIHNGPISDGLFICHTCDVRNCVNPDHLFTGTRSDNMRDMVAKNRHPKHKANHVFGETHPQSKLTDSDVRAIRSAYAAGGVTLLQLATRYGISPITIHNAIHRITWKHVKD